MVQKDYRQIYGPKVAERQLGKHLGTSCLCLAMQSKNITLSENIFWLLYNNNNEHNVTIKTNSTINQINTILHREKNIVSLFGGFGWFDWICVWFF